MKNKKIIFIFSILLLIILIGGFFAILYFKGQEEQFSNEEYVPEQEITEEQFRQTIVSLYFPNKETNELNPEARLVDIKEIINNPYEKLMQLLIEGPKSDKLIKIIPENTKVLKIYMEGDCLVLDLSNDFLKYSKENENNKSNLINSIVNTMTELTEVNSVKFLIDGNQSEEFKDVYIREK